MVTDAFAVPLAADSAALSSWRAFWSAFRENRGAVMGLVVVSVIVLVAVFADVVAPHPPNEQFRDAVRTGARAGVTTPTRLRARREVTAP